MINEQIMVVKDILSKLEIGIERMSAIQGSINESYFSKYSSGRSELDCQGIVYEHDRYGMFSDIEGDYLYKLREDFKELEKIINELEVAK